MNRKSQFCQFHQLHQLFEVFVNFVNYSSTVLRERQLCQVTETLSIVVERCHLEISTKKNNLTILFFCTNNGYEGIVIFKNFAILQIFFIYSIAYHAIF